jgi:hypothetical protein
MSVPKRKMSHMGASMAAGAFPQEMNMFDPQITAIMWFAKEAPSLKSTVTAVEKYAWPCHRFNSCIEGGSWVRKHETMDLEYHFEERCVQDEAAIDEAALQLQLTSLDTNYPRWKVVILHAQTGMSAVIVNVHHSIGDGLGLLFTFSPMLGVEGGGNSLATVPLPNALLPPSARAAKANLDGQKPKKTSSTSCFRSIGNFCRGVCSPLTTKYDTELSINEPWSKRKPNLPYNGQRKFTRFPPVPMTAVKAVQTRHGCTLNDAVMAALTGALRKYAIEIKDDQVLKAGTKQVDCKSMVMIALPRPVDEANLSSALVNRILFSSMKIPIEESSPRARLDKTVAACNDLKSGAYMSGLSGFTNCISGTAPSSVLKKAAGEEWSKHTLLVTNVPATKVKATFPAEDGQEIAAIHCAISNVMSQVSVISYNGFVYSSLVADPALFPSVGSFGQMFLQEFDVLANA